MATGKEMFDTSTWMALVLLAMGYVSIAAMAVSSAAHARAAGVTSLVLAVGCVVGAFAIGVFRMRRERRQDNTLDAALEQLARDGTLDRRVREAKARLSL